MGFCEHSIGLMNGVCLGGVAQELGHALAHTDIGVTHVGYEQDKF